MALKSKQTICDNCKAVMDYDKEREGYFCELCGRFYPGYTITSLAGSYIR